MKNESLLWISEYLKQWTQPEDARLMFHISAGNLHIRLSVWDGGQWHNSESIIAEEALQSGGSDSTTLFVLEGMRQELESLMQTTD